MPMVASIISPVFFNWRFCSRRSLRWNSRLYCLFLPRLQWMQLQPVCILIFIVSVYNKKPPRRAALVLFRPLSASDLREADGLTLLYGFGFRLIYFTGLAVFVSARFNLYDRHALSPFLVLKNQIVRSLNTATAPRYSHV